MPTLARSLISGQPASQFTTSWSEESNTTSGFLTLELGRRGVTCSCGWMGPMFNMTVLAAIFSVLMWFARDGERLEDALGFQMATATLQPRGALGHALLPRAGEPCSSQSPHLQPKVVLLLELSQICSTVHDHQMIYQCPGLHRHQWSLQEAGLLGARKTREEVSQRDAEWCMLG